MSKQLLFIFLGGGLGSTLRFMFSIWINHNQLKWVPTLFVNCLGCLLLGVFIALYHKETMNTSLYTLLGIGFCGGLTTFSTFSLDLFQLIKSGAHGSAISYLLLTILLGYFLLYSTYYLTKQCI